MTDAIRDYKLSTARSDAIRLSGRDHCEYAVIKYKTDAFEAWPLDLNAPSRPSDFWGSRGEIVERYANGRLVQ